MIYLFSYLTDSIFDDDISKDGKYYDEKMQDVTTERDFEKTLDPSVLWLRPREL